MGGANTPPTPRSKLQIELLQCRDLLDRKNQELAQLRSIPTISAAPHPPAWVADGPLPVAQRLSPRYDGFPLDDIQANINGRPEVPRQRRSIISRMLSSNQREPARSPGDNAWERRSLPNGRQLWWNSNTRVARWEPPRRSSRSSSIVPVNGSGSGTRNMKKKNKKKARKRKER